MKVIKAGRKQKGWSTEQECTGYGNGLGGCGALLLVEVSDVYITLRCCLHETDVFYTFRCPCGVETDLRSVPQVVREAAEKRYRAEHDGKDWRGP